MLLAAQAAQQPPPCLTDLHAGLLTIDPSETLPWTVGKQVLPYDSQDSAMRYLLDAINQAGIGVQANCVRGPQRARQVHPAAAGCALQGAASHGAQAARRRAA
jgi:hypothetical protein